MKNINDNSINDLKDRIIFTVLLLVVYRFGSYIPISGIDHLSLMEFVKQNNSGVLAMFNLLSGGALERMSIFALSIFPYITSSIVIQLVSLVYPPLEEMKKEGEIGRKKVNQLSRMLTVALASVQALGIANGFLYSSTLKGKLVVIDPNFFILSTIVTLTVGTMIIMWLGEQITVRGIGNGSSIIIFTGIVSVMPSSFMSVIEFSRKGVVSTFAVLFVLLTLVLLVFVIVFVEKSFRKVAIQYPKRQVGNKLYAGDSTYLPLKINTAGVIPPIFATSLLAFPLTLANFGSGSGEIVSFFSNYLNRGKPLFVILTCALIVLFSFLYTVVIFNSKETANNLRKYGAYVQGKRPGDNTAEYFDYILSKITVLGAVYLCVIFVLPEILINQFAITSSLSGTSLLILVNVVLDTAAQVQSYIFSSRYESVMKKIKLK